MSTSTTHQQSLADVGSETRSPMLERGSYILWASHFRRYLNRKRENRMWLNKAIDEAEIEAMNLILISILNDIYNSVYACTTAQAMWQRVERLMRGTMQNKVDRETRFKNEFDQFVAELGEALVSVYNRFAQLMNDLEQNGIKFPKVIVNTKFLNCLQPEWLKYVTQVRLAKKLTEDSYDDLFDYLSQYEKLINASKANKLEKSHDPLALVAHTSSSSKTSSPYYVTHPSSVVDYDDDYQGDAFQNNYEDPLTSAMINSRNDGRNTRRSFVPEEIIKGNNIQNDVGNTQRTLRTTSLGSATMFSATIAVRKDEAGVTLTDEQNDFHVADATRMEEIKELSANICLMAKIQPTNIDSDAGPSYDSVFLSEVQIPSISYVNPLFALDNKKQKYTTQPKIINDTIGDDQIDSNIIFDEPNVDVNSGSVEYDNNVQASYELEKLARNAYKEAEKQQIKSALSATWKQNELLNDQLLEAKLKHKIECCVLLSHECVNNNVQDEIEKIQWDSIEIQEGMEKQINILENDVQRCQKQSLDFELQLQHEKERQKCESSLKNVCETSWISKMEKLESENVSLEFQVQSLIKERENVKSEYQKLFDSIKKTRTQTQGEINELIEHVNQKTYANAEVRAQNQDLLITISDLKAKLKNVKKGKSVNTKFDKANVSNKLLCVTSLNKQHFQKKTVAPKTEEKHVLLKAASSVRRPSNRDSPYKNSVLSNTKKSSKKVEVSVRRNKKTYVTSKNVVSNKKIVTDVDVKKLLKRRIRALFTTPRTAKSTFEDTTLVVSMTRFSVTTTQSKSLDTTPVVSKTKIAAVTPLSAKNKISSAFKSISHMTGDRSLLKNFVEKFMGIVRFRNNLFAAITGYGDYVQGNITAFHVYYVEGLGHNLFSVGQFCDGDFKVAFRSNTCYVQNLEGDDLLTGAHESNLYTISISDMAASLPVCLLSKATSTKSWLWHRRLSHLNFSTIHDLTKHDLVDGIPKFKYSKDHLCSTCERGKSKKSSHQPKLVPSTHSKVELLHMDLCGPMRVATINGKKYILLIVDDYSRFTWVYFLHIKDETPEIIKKITAQVQLNYNAKVHKI
ncbi:integrase, catalytic region, zinc finger, CCHC-type containing protein [Tanacetum coccineum]|uniref:Integrase, catalytic region, zinc finger, CCHC-type containing protein n=1 Tax=Tanacetum coccineum TaxID=301880 RepID=A0ABQ5D504_9ASTR